MNRVAPVSVVISSFEEGDELRATAESVLNSTPAPQEVVIVDDGSTDGSCEGIWPSGVCVVRQPHLGIAAARNRGARAATQAILVFLDAHCTVDGGWLVPLLGVLAYAPNALVGPATRDAREPGSIGVGGRIVDPLLRYQWRPPTGAGAVEEVGLVPGGCMAMGRDRFLQAGGFAAFDGYGAEDVEIALRWWRAGYPILGVPESVVTHRFRTAPPYRPDHRAWVQNILRTALLHFSGRELHACVTACAQFAPFPDAIATVLSEPWFLRAQQLATSEVRDMVEYIKRWAPDAFPKLEDPPGRRMADRRYAAAGR